MENSKREKQWKKENRKRRFRRPGVRGKRNIQAKGYKQVTRKWRKRRWRRRWKEIGKRK